MSEEKRLGRRNLFLGIGTTVATGAALDACGTPKAPSTAASGVFGPDALRVSLRVNGSDHPIAIEPRQTLAEVLREALGLTGTKIGCDRGSCSACTVWIDGAPVCACTTFALDALGREVTTIEGLANGEVLHAVQEAFIEHDAMQCGYCTPGMVMSCAALLARKKQVSLADVQAATSGNLCRCGSYPKVFEATLAAAARRGA